MWTPYQLPGPEVLTPADELRVLIDVGADRKDR
jgi:hypothetical protein